MGRAIPVTVVPAQSARFFPILRWKARVRRRRSAIFFRYRSVLELPVAVPVSGLPARPPPHLPSVFTRAELRAVLAIRTCAWPSGSTGAACACSSACACG